jgi:hypothetical protein
VLRFDSMVSAIVSIHGAGCGQGRWGVHAPHRSVSYNMAFRRLLRDIFARTDLAGSRAMMTYGWRFGRLRLWIPVLDSAGTVRILRQHRCGNCLPKSRSVE